MRNAIFQIPIAKGFETTVIADDLGTVHTGIVRSETDEVVELILADHTLVERRLEKLDKSKNYYVYCRSGGRSAQAATLMDQMGFNETYNLLGGFKEWDGDVEE